MRVNELSDIFGFFAVMAGLCLAIGIIAAWKFRWPSVLDSLCRHLWGLAAITAAAGGAGLIAYVSTVLGQSEAAYRCLEASEDLAGPYSPLAALGGVLISAPIGLLCSALYAFVPGDGVGAARFARRSLAAAVGLSALASIVLLPGVLGWIEAVSTELVECATP